MAQLLARTGVFHRRNVAAGLEERDRVLDVGIVAARGWRREEADVRQLRVVVHEVRTELGAAAEIFGVVLHRDAVLALVAGIPVALAIERAGGDRYSVVSGKRVSVRVDLGGCGIIKKKSKVQTTNLHTL